MSKAEAGVGPAVSECSPQDSCSPAMNIALGAEPRVRFQLLSQQAQQGLLIIQHGMLSIHQETP